MGSSGSTAWEQRWHPLREEWVIMAAHRQNRPWQGEHRSVSEAAVPAYVESCYFCPRNVRVSGARRTQHVQAGTVWHAQVSEDEAVTGIRDLIERRAGVNRFRYAVSGIFES